ncbi:recombinase family protein [Streptomyces sp. NPDC054958]
MQTNSLAGLRLVRYFRVSGASQVDAYGLDTQDTQTQKWSDFHQVRLVGKPRSDEGLSGTLAGGDRPGLAECVELIIEGKADGLLMIDLDRFGREITVQEAALAYIWSKGGRVFTVTAGEILPDDPSDPMRAGMRQMMGVFNGIVRAMTVYRLREGKAEKAEKGGYVGGAPAYGQQAAQKELEDKDAETDVRDRMRQWHEVDGVPYAEIARRLNAEGVPTKRQKKDGPRLKWHASTVSRILDQDARERENNRAAIVRDQKRLAALEIKQQRSAVMAGFADDVHGNKRKAT